MLRSMQTWGTDYDAAYDCDGGFAVYATRVNLLYCDSGNAAGQVESY